MSNTSDTVHWGLCCADFSQYLPQESVNVSVTVVDSVADVNIVQGFWNPSADQVVRCVYSLPLDEAAAVYGFTATFGNGGRVLVAKIKEKAQAQQEYDAAVAHGLSASLMKQVRDDVFLLEIGNVQPQERVEIQVQYVARLKVEGEYIKFFVPTSMVPRYQARKQRRPEDQVPALIIHDDDHDEDNDGDNNNDDHDEDNDGDNNNDDHDVKEGGRHEHVQNEKNERCDDDDDEFVPAAPLSMQVPNNTIWTLNAIMRSRIVEIVSPTDKIEWHPKSEEEPNIAQVAITVASTRDVVILISVEAPHQPRVVVEESLHDDTYAALCTLCPEFTLKDQKCEFIFVVDRSGSMHGDKIKQASNALQLFLKSLPRDCYFNIIGFGSSFDQLFSASRRYSPDTVKKATKHAAGIAADLGGTELVPPLQAIAKLPPVPQYSRQILVLTDGGIGNTNEAFALVRTMCNNSNTRVFALGLGLDVSHHLVEGIAREGYGTAVYATEEDVNLNKKIIGQLKDAIQPALCDIRVDWGLQALAGSGEERLHQVPVRPPALFGGSLFSIMTLYSTQYGVPTEVSVTAASMEGPMMAKIPLSIHDVVQGAVIHRLTAREMIREISQWDCSEEEKKIKIIPLALKYSLLSKYTSFVAVEEATGAVVGSTHCNDSREYVEMGAVQFRKASTVLRCKHNMALGLLMKLGSGVGKMIDVVGSASNTVMKSIRNRENKDAAASIESKEDDNADNADEKQQVGKRRAGFSGLVQLQGYDGSFECNAAFARIVGVDQGKITASIASGMTATVWCTIIAVAFMRTKLSFLKDEWELMAEKSIEYVTVETQNKINMEEMLKRASLLLQ